jgi:hypothetical protein
VVLHPRWIVRGFCSRLRGEFYGLAGWEGEGRARKEQELESNACDTSSADASKEPRALEATGAREAGSSNRPTANLATIQTVWRKSNHVMLGVGWAEVRWVQNKISNLNIFMFEYFYILNILRLNIFPT